MKRLIKYTFFVILLSSIYQCGNQTKPGDNSGIDTSNHQKSSADTMNRAMPPDTNDTNTVKKDTSHIVPK